MKKSNKLPFFKISLGFTISYISIFIIIPLAMLFISISSLNISSILDILDNTRVLHALSLTFVTSLIAAIFNLPIGTLIAWSLVRYEFWGKKILNLVIDIPFILPTSVTGIALTTLYNPNEYMGYFLSKLGIEAIYNHLSIVIALIFVSLPFVIRTIEPAIKKLDQNIEEAAYYLGASPFQIFAKITLPAIAPACITGFTLAFARCIGEYGSLVFVSGNIPGYTETLPLLISLKLEQFDYESASLLAIYSLILSFILLLIVNYFDKHFTSRNQS